MTRSDRRGIYYFHVGHFKIWPAQSSLPAQVNVCFSLLLILPFSKAPGGLGIFLILPPNPDPIRNMHSFFNASMCFPDLTFFSSFYTQYSFPDPWLPTPKLLHYSPRGEILNFSCPGPWCPPIPWLTPFEYHLTCGSPTQQLSVAVHQKSPSQIFEVLHGWVHFTLHPHLSLLYCTATWLEWCRPLNCPLCTACSLLLSAFVPEGPPPWNTPPFFSTEESICCISFEAQSKNQFLQGVFSNLSCPILFISLYFASLAFSQALLACMTCGAL